jgi:hypothetical protein
MNSSHFENRNNLRNTAKDILNRQGATENGMKSVLNETIFSNSNSNPQLSIIQASSQITLNNSLKETLKYLKTQANKKVAKEPVLGELWNLFDKEDLNYQGELVDFVIDNSVENIFAA